MYILERESYILSEPKKISRVLKRLQKKLVLEEEDVSQQQSVFFDTFDWRLYQQAYLLEERQQGKKSTLLLHQIGTTEVILTEPKHKSYKNTPFFSEALEALANESFHQRLAPLLSMRALLPLVEVHSRRQCYRVLNKDRKTVLRLAFDQHSTQRLKQDARSESLEATEAQILPCRIHLLPVRGYQSALHKVHAEFAKNNLLQIAERSLLEDALAAIGREALDYSSKLSLPLAPDMSTLSALQTIFLTLLGNIRVNELGLREDIDSEFLHDFRVAIRRTRSALSQIKKVYPEETLQHFKTEFAWLGGATGACRDLDVYLLGFEDYRQALPSAYQDALLPFRDFLIQQKQKARKDLLKTLDSKRYYRLLREWETLQIDPESTLSDQPCESCKHHDLPIHYVAAERILRLFKRIIKDGRNIHPETEDDYVHELRIECKKLRYLLEFFKSIYPPKKIKGLIKSLKHLQENLGDFNDVVVQAEHLHRFSQQMLKQGKGSVETILAMGALISQLDSRKHKLRADFHQEFEQFDIKATHKTVALLFAGHTIADDKLEVVE